MSVSPTYPPALKNNSYSSLSSSSFGSSFFASSFWGSFAIIEDDIEKYYLKSYLTQNDAQYIIQALTNGMSHLVERSA